MIVPRAIEAPTLYNSSLEKEKYLRGNYERKRQTQKFEKRNEDYKRLHFKICKQSQLCDGKNRGGA